MPRGYYVVLEGGEGTGKTTQAELLMGHLSSQGIEGRYLREPGGTEAGEKMRSLALDPELDVTVLAQAHLHNGARVQMLEKVVMPLLAQGIWVVSDRSFISTIVYQGHGQRGPIEDLRQLTGLAARLRAPDLIILLDGDPDRLLARREMRGTHDRFEAMDLTFHNRIREGYNAEIKRLHDSSEIKVARVFAERAIEEVAEDIAWAVGKLREGKLV